MNKPNWIQYDLPYREPALCGLLAQVPSRWTAEERRQWIDAFLLVLDYTHPAKDALGTPAGEDARG